MHVRLITAALLFGSWVGLAGAYTGDVSAAAGMHLDDAVNEALRSNAGLTAAMQRWAGAQQRGAQQAAPANPTLAYRGMDRSSGGDFPDTAEKRVEFQQPLSWPGKRSLRVEAARRDADREAMEYQAAALDMALAVREAGYDFIAARAGVEIARAEVSTLDGLSDAARGRYQAGAGELGAALRANAERTLARQRIVDSVQRSQSAGIRLGELLNRDGSVAVEADASVSSTGAVPALDGLLAAAARLRPEIRASEAEVQRARAARRLAGQDRYPDYFLGGEYRSIRDGDDQVMFAVGLDLPVWRSKVGAGVREASHTWQAALAREAEVRRRVESEVRDAHQRLAAARETARLYAAELMPAARLRAEQARSGYAAARTEFGELVEAELALLGARRMTVEADAEAGRSAARLLRAVGVTAPSALIVP